LNKAQIVAQPFARCGNRDGFEPTLCATRLIIIFIVQALSPENLSGPWLL
jgi:hypothetical protein